MTIPKWLDTVLAVAPYALAAVPGIPPGIIPYAQAAIVSAEQIPGADGPTKLASALAIAQAGFGAAQAAGAHLDASAISADLAAGMSLVVKLVNEIHGKTAAAPSAPPAPATA